MKKTAIGGAILTAVFASTATAGEAKIDYGAVVQEMLRLMDEMTTQLKTVTETDANSAATAKPMLLESAKEFVAVRKKAKEAKPPSQEEKFALETKFREKMVKAQKLFFAEMARVRTFETGKMLVAEIAKALAEKKNGEKK